MRTDISSVTFRRPFMLPGFDRPHAPGSFEVRTDHERLDTVVEAWRRTLVVLIREGRPSLAELARAHHMSPRSLQRRLAERGLGFQRLLDDTRQHLAESYLRQPGLELAEIALLLGFSEQSAFTRAFRQWVGQAPAQWRKQMLSATGATPPDAAAQGGRA